MPLGALRTHVVLPNTSHLFVVKDKRANGQEIRFKLKAQTERYLIWFLSGDENVSSMTLTMYVKQFLSQVDKFNPISTWTQISPQALWGLDDELCDWNYLMKQAAVLMFMTANCKLMVQQIKHDSLL